MARTTHRAALVLLLLAACTPSRSLDAAPPPSPAVSDHAPPAAAGGRTYVKPSDAELKARLTPLQYEVTQEGATEPPFHNDFWNNHAAGLYVDVATGEPLFSSQDKFESGTGWPSFTRPVEPGRVVEHRDETLGMVRTEVVSRAGGSHLGHVFDDGPPPTGMRYCIDSAALRFIPVDQLVAQGYGDYAARFGVAVASPPPPAATSNSCAVPPPGSKPGCSATLESVILASSARDDRLAKTPGVLSVAPGYEGNLRAVEVTYDPAKLSFPQLLGAWTGGDKPGDAPATVFAQGDAQKSAAKAAPVQVVEAVPFKRN